MVAVYYNALLLYHNTSNGPTLERYLKRFVFFFLFTYTIKYEECLQYVYAAVVVVSTIRSHSFRRVAFDSRGLHNRRAHSAVFQKVDLAGHHHNKSYKNMCIKFYIFSVKLFKSQLSYLYFLRCAQKQKTKDQLFYFRFN